MNSKTRVLVPLAAASLAAALAGGALARPGDDAADRLAGPAAAAAPADIAGCPMLPADNIWNTPVDTLPVDAMSAAYVNTIGASGRVHADFGSGLWDGGKIGIPYVVVPGDQPRVALTFRWPGESDAGPYPVPTDAPIEGPPDGNGDRHILVVDRDNCVLYEIYNAYWQENGSIRAGSGAIFDLRSNALRTAGWTSADAAGLPILPGLVRYDEAVAGEIRHAIRFTVPETRNTYVWPGRHQASDLVAARFPPMGQRFRLKASVSLEGYSPEIRAIVVAMKTYGVMLADNGSAWFLSGVPDERWNNDHVHELDRLRGSDFEAVDVSSLMADPNSGRVLGAVPTETPTTEPTSPAPTDAPPTATEPPPTATEGVPVSPTAGPTQSEPTDVAPTEVSPTDGPATVTPAGEPTAAPTAAPTSPSPRWWIFLPRLGRERAG